MNASSTVVRALPRTHSSSQSRTRQSAGDTADRASSQQNRQSKEDKLFEARLQWFLALSSIE